MSGAVITENFNINIRICMISSNEENSNYEIIFRPKTKEVGKKTDIKYGRSIKILQLYTLFVQEKSEDI